LIFTSTPCGTATGKRPILDTDTSLQHRDQQS
jgi:hypothetical protein